jgi:hypothetical protein
LRRLYSCIHEVDRRHHVHDYDVDVALPPEAKTDLLWWSSAMLQFRDAQVLRGVGAKVIRQHSDASGDGWGCTAQIHKNIRPVIDAQKNTPCFSRHIRPNGGYFSRY